MAYETSKAIIRRSYDKRYAVNWLIGDGIDIGAGTDSLDYYTPLFPLMGKVKAWDRADGDAMLMASVPDNSYQFVHSSHCLEHLDNPMVGLKNWIRICKPGGHLVLMVPDEDLYEQGVWPSTYNGDHKWTFTIGKQRSWSPQSINLLDLLRDVLDQVRVIKIELLDINYFYGSENRWDQTETLVGESAIEVILRKIPPK